MTAVLEEMTEVGVARALRRDGHGDDMGTGHSRRGRGGGRGGRGGGLSRQNSATRKHRVSGSRLRDGSWG